MDRRSKRIFGARQDEAGVHRPSEAQGPPARVPATQQPDPAAIEDELQARREEIARMQERAIHEAEAQRLKRAGLEKREQALEDRERNLEQQAEELKRAKRVQRKELERLSGLTAAQAKQMLIADVEHDAQTPNSLLNQNAGATVTVGMLASAKNFGNRIVGSACGNKCGNLGCVTQYCCEK
jgi:ribonuclease Y